MTNNRKFEPLLLDLDITFLGDLYLFGTLSLSCKAKGIYCSRLLYYSLSRHSNYHCACLLLPIVGVYKDLSDIRLVVASLWHSRRFTASVVP